MKSPLFFFVVASGFALQSAFGAVSLIDFNVANGTGAGSSQNTSRSLSSATTSLGRIDFDTSTPFFPANGQQTLYGGLQAVNSATGGTFSQSAVRFHDNDPDAWPNSPQVFANINDSSGGVSYNDVTMAMVFKKEDFTNFSTGTVGFDASSTLALHMTNWSQTPPAVGGNPVEIRFLVQEGSTYYVSEEVRTSQGAGDLTLTDFNDNSTVGKRWAPVTMTGTSFGIPNTLSFQAVDFQDVQQIGFVAEGSRQYGAQWGFDTFSATGIPEPGTALLVLAGLPLLLRRRRERASS